MRLPLILLAIGAIAAGFVFVEKFIGAEQHEFWRGAIFTAVWSLEVVAPPISIGVVKPRRSISRAT